MATISFWLYCRVQNNFLIFNSDQMVWHFWPCLAEKIKVIFQACRLLIIIQNAFIRICFWTFIYILLIFFDRLLKSKMRKLWSELIAFKYRSWNSNARKPYNVLWYISSSWKFAILYMRYVFISIISMVILAFKLKFGFFNVLWRPTFTIRSMSQWNCNFRDILFSQNVVVGLISWSL